jgi:mannose-6-phosphate isomerase-like protein (cupin superfamily)
MAGRTLNLTGNQATIKATSEETGGTFALLEFVAVPGAPELFAHVHTREDECLYVIEGRLLVTVGQDEQLVEAGGFVFMPRRAMHCWRNPDPNPARFLTMLLPAGGERYFLDLAAALAAGTPPTIEALTPLMAHHGMRPVQPVVRLVGDHGSTR